MSRIEEEIRATGLAQVIVILKKPQVRRAALERGAVGEVAAQPDLAGVSTALEKYFTASQFSHNTVELGASVHWFQSASST